MLGPDDSRRLWRWMDPWMGIRSSGNPFNSFRDGMSLTKMWGLPVASVYDMLRTGPIDSFSGATLSFRDSPARTLLTLTMERVTG